MAQLIAKQKVTIATEVYSSIDCLDIYFRRFLYQLHSRAMLNS
jgi:hypothetical protein